VRRVVVALVLGLRIACDEGGVHGVLMIVMKFPMIPDETTLAHVESLPEQPCQGLGLA
jgi:hypothetical protein